MAKSMLDKLLATHKVVAADTRFTMRDEHVTETSSTKTSTAAAEAPPAQPAGGLLRDLRFAARQFRRRPGFTAAVLTTLALGIGANTVIFSVVSSILLRALPYQEPDQLMRLWPDAAVPRAIFEIIRDGNQAFGTVAGYSFDQRFSLTGQGAPARLEGVAVTSEFFTTLGVSAAIGQTFEGGEDRPGADRLAVLSHDLFARRFGADPSIVGGTIQLDGIERTVLGVMPPEFQFPNRTTDLWIPAVIDPRNFTLYWDGPGMVRLLGRLQEGASVEQGNLDFKRLMPQIREAFPWDMPNDYGQAAQAISLHEDVVGDVRPVLYLLLAAVGLVLLIACVNVANLLLVHARARRKELALRAAFGAGPQRIVRQLLTESLLLGVLGGALGFAGGWAALAILRQRLPADLPRVEEISLDGRVLGFTLLTALATGVIFGLLPALRASRPDLQQSLRDTSKGAGAGRGHRHLMSTLVTSEVALTVVLAIGAGLLIQSFWQELRTDPGFRPESVLSAAVAPPEQRYATPDSQRLLYAELLERLAALPGAREVGLASRIPFGGEIFGSVFLIDGRAIPKGGDWPVADASVVVSPTYLPALGTELLRGRWLDDTDHGDAPGAVLVSESLAQRYWSLDEAVGQRIKFPGQESWKTIVGVVADMKLGRLSETSQATLYQPLAQGPVGPMSLIVRTEGNPRSLAPDLRTTVAAVEPEMPVSEISPLEALVSTSMSQSRLTMALVLGFAALALCLAAVGIYGVTAYAVSQQKQEIAVRLALGAEPGRVLRLFLRRGATVAVIGIVVGLPAAFALSRLLESLLYGVSATDAPTFAAAALLLAIIATLASYIPARRVTRIDPMSTLRVE